jgi:hypothetical protein
MKKVFLFGLCSFLLACDGNELISPAENSYLPLQVGNSWKFVAIGPTQTDRYSFKRVTAETTLEGTAYYEVVSGYANPQEAEVVQDTLYYRIDNKGFVYIRGKQDDLEKNLFRLNGLDGDSWTFEIEGYTVSMDLAIVSLDIDEKELKKCKAFFYDVDVMADEEYTTTFAKGIGFVKIYSNAWANGSILKTAVIDGHTFEF